MTNNNNNWKRKHFSVVSKTREKLIDAITEKNLILKNQKQIEIFKELSYELLLHENVYLEEE